MQRRQSNRSISVTRGLQLSSRLKALCQSRRNTVSFARYKAPEECIQVCASRLHGMSSHAGYHLTLTNTAQEHSLRTLEAITKNNELKKSITSVYFILWRWAGEDVYMRDETLLGIEYRQRKQSRQDFFARPSHFKRLEKLLAGLPELKERVSYPKLDYTYDHGANLHDRSGSRTTSQSSSSDVDHIDMR
jgi:hypothetical protein